MKKSYWPLSAAKPLLWEKRTVDFADLDGNLLISNDRFKGVEVVKGKITLNDLPGIGVMKI